MCVFTLHGPGEVGPVHRSLREARCPDEDRNARPPRHLAVCGAQKRDHRTVADPGGNLNLPRYVGLNITGQVQSDHAPPAQREALGSKYLRGPCLEPCPHGPRCLESVVRAAQGAFPLASAAGPGLDSRPSAPISDSRAGIRQAGR